VQELLVTAVGLPDFKEARDSSSCIYLKAMSATMRWRQTLFFSLARISRHIETSLLELVVVLVSSLSLKFIIELMCLRSH
jgi:hypothetical protein